MEALRAETMFASLETVDDRLSTLLSANSYVDRDVFGPADEATRALASLGEAFVRAAPFPSVGRTELSSVDADVGAHLQAQYVTELRATDHVPDVVPDGGDGEGIDRVSPLIESALDESGHTESPLDESELEESGLEESGLNASALDESELDASALDESARVQFSDGSIVVPLARTGPRARNWGPVLAVLRSVVEALLACARTLVRRVRTVDELYVQDACHGVYAMLASLRDVVVRSGSGVRFVNRRSDQGSEAPMSFATWASERLSNDRTPSDRLRGDHDA